MSALGQGIDALYFGYRSLAGHMEGCSRHGSDTWEATRFTWSSYSGDKTEVTIRLACHECGVVHFERTDFELSTETTHASQIGYAGRPERVLGVWLWPGPRVWYGEEHGPVSYLITVTWQPPRRADEVIGRVGWHLGKRHGVRWCAGAGCTRHGTVVRASEEAFSSRRAAVAWVIANVHEPLFTIGGAQ